MFCCGFLEKDHVKYQRVLQVYPKTICGPLVVFCCPADAGILYDVEINLMKVGKIHTSLIKKNSFNDSSVFLMSKPVILINFLSMYDVKDSCNVNQ